MKTATLLFALYVNIFANNFEKYDNIVIDIKSNIMWQDNVEVTQYKENLTMSKLYCNELILNSYTNWRLPTIKELINIIDIKSKRYINNKFKFTSQSKYSTTTTFVLDNKKIWYVDFANGKLDYQNSINKFNIRCIRTIK
jgi:hypothetical protein